MEKIKITFLGTSDMIPTPQRSHTAILLKYKAEDILIDCGEGTQVQFRKAKLNPCKVTRILISHWHGDHVIGLPGLIQTLAQSEYPKTLKIYGPVGTKEYIKNMLKGFIFGGIEYIKIDITEINNDGVFIDEEDFKIEAYQLSHRCPVLGYSFIEKDKTRIDKKKLNKLGISGKIVGELKKGKNIKIKGKTIKSKDLVYFQKGRKISTLFDTGLCKNCYAVAKNADLLISDSTFLDKDYKEKAQETEHLTAKQAAEIAKKGKAKKLFLTHISQRFHGKEKILLEEAKKVFKNTELAKDLMIVEI